MNKEEIEKKKKMLRDFSQQGQGQRVFFEEDLELIRDILQELEQKETIINMSKCMFKRDNDLSETIRIIAKELRRISRRK